MHAFVEEMFHPRAGGVNQAARVPGEFFAAIDIFRFHHPQAVFAFCRDSAGAGANLAAFTYHHLGVGKNQTRIVDPAVGIFETAHDFWLKYRFRAKAQTGRARQAGTFAEVIV